MELACVASQKKTTSTNTQHDRSMKMVSSHHFVITHTDANSKQRDVTYAGDEAGLERKKAKQKPTFGFN